MEIGKSNLLPPFRASTVVIRHALPVQRIAPRGPQPRLQALKREFLSYNSRAELEVYDVVIGYSQRRVILSTPIGSPPTINESSFDLPMMIETDNAMKLA